MNYLESRASEIGTLLEGGIKKFEKKKKNNKKSELKGVSSSSIVLNWSRSTVLSPNPHRAPCVIETPRGALFVVAGWLLDAVADADALIRARNCNFILMERAHRARPRVTPRNTRRKLRGIRYRIIPSSAQPLPARSVSPA